MSPNSHLQGVQGTAASLLLLNNIGKSGIAIFFFVQYKLYYDKNTGGSKQLFTINAVSF